MTDLEKLKAARNAAHADRNTAIDVAYAALDAARDAYRAAYNAALDAANDAYRDALAAQEKETDQ